MSLLKSPRNCISNNITAKFATQETIALEWSQFEILAGIFELQPSLKAVVTCICLTVGCLPLVSVLAQRHTRTLPTEKNEEAKKKERGGPFYSIKI